MNITNSETLRITIQAAPHVKRYREVFQYRGERSCDVFQQCPDIDAVGLETQFPTFLFVRQSDIGLGDREMRRYLIE